MKRAFFLVLKFTIIYDLGLNKLQFIKKYKEPLTPSTPYKKVWSETLPTVRWLS